MGSPNNRHFLAWGLAGLGIGAFLFGATAFVVGLVLLGLLIAPLAVWFAWNVLNFAAAIGAAELGFWGIILLTLFLVSGFGGRLLMALIVWLVDPRWLADSATLHWPQASWRTCFALLILLLVAQIPVHRHDAHDSARRSNERRARSERDHPPTIPARPTA